MFTKSSRGGVATGRSVWGCLCTIKVENHRDEIIAHVPGATGSVWRRHVISEVDFARFSVRSARGTLGAMEGGDGSEQRVCAPAHKSCNKGSSIDSIHNLALGMRREGSLV